jgi:Tfp pilus assembly protein PilF
MVAILAFAGVNHLVTRFREQQKALARRMFRRGLEQVSAGMPERAVENFRVALAYDRENDQYQLSLARALRDTGRVEESRSYLIALWERRPEDSTVNLALARLAVRQGSIQEALRYYHNAMYGAWPSNGDSKRRDAEFELVDFLLRKNAITQAQAELISMTPALPSDLGYHLRIGKLFARAQDHEHSLAQFEQVVRNDHENPEGLTGAGEEAFQLGRYRSAERFLSLAMKTVYGDPHSQQLLGQTRAVLDIDPFLRRISSVQRDRRVRRAFEESGKRLDRCLASKSTSLPTSGELGALKSRWLELKPKLAHLGFDEMELHDTAMDLVFQIEQATATECGPPAGLDQALLVLAQNREGADQ